MKTLFRPLLDHHDRGISLQHCQPVRTVTEKGSKILRTGLLCSRSVRISVPVGLSSVIINKKLLG
jgi:hypothetical protein